MTKRKRLFFSFIAVMCLTALLVVPFGTAFADTVYYNHTVYAYGFWEDTNNNTASGILFLVLSSDSSQPFTSFRQYLQGPYTYVFARGDSDGMFGPGLYWSPITITSFANDYPIDITPTSLAFNTQFGRLIFHAFNLNDYVTQTSDPNAFNTGYNTGYSNGLSDGYSQGMSAGISYANDQITTTSASYIEGYRVGNADGYQTGYGAGVSTAQDTAYDSGYNAGYTAGNTAGQLTGYEDGYDEGYTTGISFADNRVNTDSASYQQGLTTGQTYGYQSGYTAGVTDGYEDGYDVGYDVGYSAGTEYGFSQSDFLASSVFAVGDVVFDFFGNVLNFDLFGYNLSDLFFALITALVVGKVLLMFV